MLDNLWDLAQETREIVTEAGQIIRENWSKPACVHHKGAIDLVTNTDLAVQAYLEKKLGALLPEAEFMGEEGAGLSKEKLDHLAWIIDPVDGTTNFVHHIPYVAISAALCDKGRPLLGIVHAPMLGESFLAVKGHGAWLGEMPIKVSENSILTDALVATGNPYEVRESLDWLLGQIKKILLSTQGLRRLGSAALHLAYVACGRLDVFYEMGLKPWDVAGWLLVSEAGGTVTTFEGKPFNFMEPILASNNLLHREFFKLLG